MKVERKNKVFEPVTITLESQDELNYLWHCFDGWKSLKEGNPNESYIEFPKNARDLSYEMFHALNDVMNE